MPGILDSLTDLAQGGTRTVSFNPVWDIAQQYAPGYFGQVQQQFGNAPAAAQQANPQAEQLAQTGYDVLQQQLSGRNPTVSRAAHAAVQPYAQAGTLGSARSQGAAARAAAQVAQQGQQQALQQIPAIQQAQFAPDQQQQQAQQNYIQSYYNSLGLGSAPQYTQAFRTPSTLEALGGSADLLGAFFGGGNADGDNVGILRDLYNQFS